MNEFDSFLDIFPLDDAARELSQLLGREVSSEQLQLWCPMPDNHTKIVYARWNGEDLVPPPVYGRKKLQRLASDILAREAARDTTVDAIAVASEEESIARGDLHGDEAHQPQFVLLQNADDLAVAMVAEGNAFISKNGRAPSDLELWKRVTEKGEEYNLTVKDPINLVVFYHTNRKIKNVDFDAFGRRRKKYLYE